MDEQEFLKEMNKRTEKKKKDSSKRVAKYRKKKKQTLSPKDSEMPINLDEREFSNIGGDNEEGMEDDFEEVVGQDFGNGADSEQINTNNSTMVEIPRSPRISAIPVDGNFGNFLSSEENEENSNENIHPQPEEAEEEEEEDSDYYSDQDVPRQKFIDSTFEADMEEVLREESSSNEELEEQEEHERIEIDPIEVSFHTNQPSERIQSFLENKTIPSKNLEEELEMIDKISLKVKEYLANGNVVPHDKKVFEILINGEVKTFPIFEEGAETAEIGDGNVDFILLELQKKLFRIYNKTDEINQKEFLAAAKRGELKINGERFQPRIIKLYYCPGHEKYPYHTKCGKICDHVDESGTKCNLTVKKVNSVLMLSLADVLTISLSNPKAFQCVLEKNKDFSEKYFAIKNGLIRKLELENTTEILDISDAALIKILINEGFYQYNEITKVIGITLNVFIDEIEVWKRSKYKNVCMIMACVNEFDPSFRFKEAFLFPIGGFQTRYKHNNSILAAFSTAFQHAACPQELKIYFYSPGVSVEVEKIYVKCLVIAIICGLFFL